MYAGLLRSSHLKWTVRNIFPSTAVCEVLSYCNSCRDLQQQLLRLQVECVVLCCIRVVRAWYKLLLLLYNSCCLCWWSPFASMVGLYGWLLSRSLLQRCNTGTPFCCRVWLLHAQLESVMPSAQLQRNCLGAFSHGEACRPSQALQGTCIYHACASTICYQPTVVYS